MATGYLPTFKVFKDGENITARFQDRSCDIKVELASGNGSQDTCTITLDDRDWLIARPQVDDFLDIELGYKEVGTTYMNTFEIDKVTFTYPPKGITIHGQAQGNNSLLKSQKVIEYENKTVGEILNSIGSAVGIGVAVDPDLAKEKIPFKNNHASPQHLVSQLEKQYNAVAKIANGKMIFVKRDEGKSASGLDLPILVLDISHFADYEVVHTNRSDYSKVSAGYTDKTTNEKVYVDSPTAVKQLEGSKAKDLPFVIGQIFNSPDEARAAAKSTMAALDRNLGEGVFNLAEGDPWIRDQQRILVRGTRDGVDGSYVVDLVTHHYTKNGALKTSIRALPPSEGNIYGLMYEQAPKGFIVPKPGQTMGEALPKK